MTYDQFVANMAKDCHCCEECQQAVCAGVLAGGLCDRMCWCDDEDEDDEGATDADE